MLADFKADLLVSQVRLSSAAALIESFLNFTCKISLLVGDIHDHRLGWRQPSWECAFVMLDQNSDETLERPQNRTVQHDRMLAIIVFADVFSAESDRQVEIELQGTALPDATQAVLERKLDLRTVESRLTRLQIVRQSSGIQRSGQRSLGTNPQLVGTHTLFRTRGELQLNISETEVGIHRLGQANEIRRLGLHLLFGTEDVRVILSKATHAHNAVQRAGGLVT